MSYICLVCQAEVDVDLDRNLIQCTRCGNRILLKPRPPALKKRVKAI
jgi:DNA-directed RNA polymerase subunit P